MLQQVFTCMYPKIVFLLPIRKVVALQIDKHTQLLCCSLQTPPSPELKVTAPFLGLPQLTLTFHSAKCFLCCQVFGQQSSCNCPRTLFFELNHFSGHFQTIPNPMPGSMFQAYLCSQTKSKRHSSAAGVNQQKGRG